jgi:serine/threonine protein kinase/tetratricopeptide (TPR) repeat protein
MSASPQTPVSPGPEDTVLEQPHARPPHPLPESIGPYRIIEVIGEGGMGIVYKGEQRDPVRRVAAIKVIKLGMDTKEIVARFDTERQALALMSHPNVAKVFEAGMTEQGRPYFAMEFVPGVPITHYCDTQKLTTRERLELFIPVCQAVQHAHQKGIIHRDLKPGNILVTLVDGKPVPKVIDFGVAKATSVQLTQHTLYTQAGTVIGTLEYMSPEQATSSGLDVDTRTDVYSLGVILYQLLTGSLPFESDTLRKAPRDKFADILQNTDPPRPSAQLTETGPARKLDTTEIARRHGTDPRSLRREIKGDLDWIVLKAMEKDRTRRYETANGLAMDLQRHLNDELVSACPPSTGYRLRKFVRRHRTDVVAAGVILITLLVGVSATTYAIVQKRLADLKTQEARKAKVTADRVSTLFQDVLSPMTPDGIRRTPVQVLDDAARRIDDGALRDDLPIAARTRSVLGQRYVAIGLYERAIKQFQAALKLSESLYGPESPELTSNINQLADAMITDDDLAGADQVLSRATQIETQQGHTDELARAWTLDLRGSVHAGRGDWAGAQTLYQEALAIREKKPGDDPQLAESLSHRAEVLLKMGNLDGQPSFDNAINMYRRLYELRPLYLIGPARRMARAAANRGDWKNWAVLDQVFFQQSLANQPQDLRLLSERISAISVQLKLKPDTQELLLRRASCYARRGEFESALTDYAEALKTKRNQPNVWHNCLPLYVQLSQTAEYNAQRHEALKLFSDDKERQVLHAVAKSSLYTDISGEDLDRASMMAEEAVRLSLRPGTLFKLPIKDFRPLQTVNPFFVQCLGMAEYRAGHFESAIDLLKFSRDHVYVYRDAAADFYIAMALAKQNHLEQAKSSFDAGLRVWKSGAPDPGKDDLEQFEDWILCESARREAMVRLAGG